MRPTRSQNGHSGEQIPQTTTDYPDFPLIQGSVGKSLNLTPGTVQALQRTIGNQATQRLVRANEDLELGPTAKASTHLAHHFSTAAQQPVDQDVTKIESNVSTNTIQKQAESDSDANAGSLRDRILQIVQRGTNDEKHGIIDLVREASNAEKHQLDDDEEFKRTISRRLHRAIYKPVLLELRKATETFEGGKAEFAILEGDLGRVIDNWLDGSRQGVHQFVHNVLAAQIGQVASGSFQEFLQVFIGGTVWSLSAFATGGLAFSVSMVGMSIQAGTTLPSNSESKANLIAVESLLNTRIEGVQSSLNKHLGNAARKLMKDTPGIRRYRAIGQFLKDNFQPDAVDIPDDYASLPKINQTGVREIMFDKANQLWTNMSDVVSKTNLTGGVGILLYDEESQKYYKLGADSDAITMYLASGGQDQSALDMMRPYGDGEILPDLVPAAKAIARQWPGYYFVGRKKPGTASDWLVEGGVKIVGHKRK